MCRSYGSQDVGDQEVPNPGICKQVRQVLMQPPTPLVRGLALGRLKGFQVLCHELQGEPGQGAFLIVSVGGEDRKRARWSRGVLELIACENVLSSSLWQYHDTILR